jgi:FMN phosphatase YigB (HAD superfamily)
LIGSLFVSFVISSSSDPVFQLYFLYRWAKHAVSENVVQAVLSAWEMARHHAAERNLYPEVIDALKQIKAEHPGVIIGAVTDGKANPQLMTFTLAPFFDFCICWEDDQGGRRQFFKELDSVDGQVELTWIYDAARHKYALLKEAADAMKKDGPKKVEHLTYPAEYDDLVWIHVGDDLAFDVGGSAACGAKTILVELAEKYGQTAPFRFDTSIEQPTWATTTTKELEARIRMNEASKELVDVQINSLVRLPVAINEILKGGA